MSPGPAKAILDAIERMGYTLLPNWRVARYPLAMCLRELFELVAREPKSHVIYSELLKSLDHPVVKPVLSRVSLRRMDYLAASFRQAGLPRLDAQNRARLAYAAYVGFLQLALQLGQPRLHRDELDAYVRHVATTLIPD